MQQVIPLTSHGFAEDAMSAVNFRLPDFIHRRMKEIALRDGVSVNQFISSAISEKISAIMTEEYLKQRAKKTNKSAFKKILDAVPDREPMAGGVL